MAEFGAWSFQYRMQHVNQRSEKQVQELKKKCETCMRMYVGGLIIYSHCAQKGISATWEWSETCDAWRLPLVQRVFEKFQPHMVVTKGCRVQLMDPKTKGLLGKGWKLATTHRKLAECMDLPCRCQERHVLCQGHLTRMSAYYTQDFAKRGCRAMLHEFDSKGLFHEMKGLGKEDNHLQGFPKECTCELVQHHKSELQCHVRELAKEKHEHVSMVGEDVVMHGP